ncbi:MAG: peptide-methionine (S)-S-oxide reductase [Anaerolineales bacterium]|nr:peptide-methionine (S)-S-oxide reductase [Anaerolineales bacterium]
MVRTRVGYAGGTTRNPTYRNLGDHSETIQIDYDPSQITYAELLELFWSGHDPSRPAGSRQYMSIIFYESEAQKRLAEETRDREAAKLGKVTTEIRPAGEFYLAEDYHQKYYLQNTLALMAEFEAIYPDAADFMNSTAVARVNGYIGGHGTLEQLQNESEALGLSPEGQQLLMSRYAR